MHRIGIRPHHRPRCRSPDPPPRAHKLDVDAIRGREAIHPSFGPLRGRSKPGSPARARVACLCMRWYSYEDMPSTETRPLWLGRSSDPPSDLALELSATLEADTPLARYDVE